MKQKIFKTLRRSQPRNPYYQGPASDHFDGVRFFSPVQAVDKRPGDVLRWQKERKPTPWPQSFPSPFQDKPPATVPGLRSVLIGHASFLIQVAGLNILTDPVFSERASPLAFAGPKRVNSPGIALKDLPPIHAVLITHNHYDHLNLKALGRIWREHRPRLIAPLGNGTIIRSWYPEMDVESGDWGEGIDLGNGVSVHFTPAYHWSARGVRDRRMALWCAYVLTTPSGVIYHVGDTGFGDGKIFHDVRERFGAPRLAHLPIGAYELRWFMAPQHMNPEDAVKAFRLLGAEQALGHHWGTFRLTDEGVHEPPQALAEALRQAEILHERFRALRPGEAFEPHL
ncbi:MBL fold metallo-hydrolase [Microvirga terricola]|uniref:MBL fold metallo-hydrolase n=1 Tax=Microvirga terricola TaxID=2719797 RepID=A0ABX0V6Y0_9HYPH|nr:MBL fold metallo-hydrolase [Microvirga terricola]NIX75472.1 MBL fold metallo-hydrolase [Microvirga terricola]